MRTPNVFTNPKTGATYSWAINHAEEEATGKDRTFEHTAPTAHGSDPGVGLIRQQGSEGPMVLKYSGTILSLAQHQEFVAWFNLCRTQSIWFRDFAGDEYEVIISSYAPKRERVMHNPRGGETARNFIIRYSISMEVLAIRSGMWAGTKP